VLQRDDGELDLRVDERGGGSMNWIECAVDNQLAVVLLVVAGMAIGVLACGGLAWLAMRRPS
jgi:hypothetical protein